MGSDGQGGTAGRQFGESQRFVEELKFEAERPLVEVHDGSDLVDVENCPSELHGHIMCRVWRRRSEESSRLCATVQRAAPIGFSLFKMTLAPRTARG